MAESLKLSLRVPAPEGRDRESLQSRIFQIYSKKGAFRNVTEASLIEDIKSRKQQDEDTEMAEAEAEAEAEESEEEEPENRYQMIIKSREDMMQQLR